MNTEKALDACRSGQEHSQATAGHIPSLCVVKVPPLQAALPTLIATVLRAIHACTAMELLYMHVRQRRQHPSTATNLDM